MRDYGKVKPSFWVGETGIKLRKRGTAAQLVALYLVTGPGATMLGMYHLPLPTLCHHTGLTSEQASEALAAIQDVGFAKWDAESEMVFVPMMAMHQIGETLKPTDNRHKGVTKELSSLKKCRFIGDFYELYAGPYGLSPLEAPSKGGRTKPLQSQEQEQEQEQEQDLEQEQETAASPRTPKFDPLKMPLPPELDTPAFKAAWSDWINSRRDRRQSLREQPIAKQLEFLASLGASAAVQSIAESIRNDWKGLFAPKGNGQNKPKSELFTGPAAFAALDKENDRDDTD